MKQTLKSIVLLKDRVPVETRTNLVGSGLYAAKMLSDESDLKQIIVLCNAGKERSRMLAGTLDSVLSQLGDRWDVVARGTYGLGSDDKGVQTKYGWVPSEGFRNLLKQEGLVFPAYPSQMLSAEEANNATWLIAVDPVIAGRAKEAFPQCSSKVIVALDAISLRYNPFPKYLGNFIPDAWGGHLSQKIFEAIDRVETIESRVERVTAIVGNQLDESSRAYLAQYTKDSNPTDIKNIPSQLRDYCGLSLDSDPAYVQEVKNLRQVAMGLIAKGYFK